MNSKLPPLKSIIIQVARNLFAGVLCVPLSSCLYLKLIMSPNSLRAALAQDLEVTDAHSLTPKAIVDEYVVIRPELPPNLIDPFLDRAINSGGVR